MEKLERNLIIVNDYLNGVSMSELVVKHSLHRSTLQKILLRHGVKLHKNKSKIKCDKNFFNVYTNESCYWAGFILADGNLRVDRNSLQLKLGKIDKNHLYSFLKDIKCEDLNLVKEYKDYVLLTIHLDEYKNGLINNFGITPNKTFTADISDKIPTDMLIHFIRGYFDGDGSITKTTTITVSFVGTEILLLKLTEYFKNKFNIILKSKNDTPPIQKSKNVLIGSVSYSGKNAIKIMNGFYNDLSENNYLKRKLNKYNEIKKDYENR
jgi:hypothetical protein